MLPNFTRRASLNRIDLDLLHRNQSLLSPLQRNLLKAVQYRLQTYPQRFGRDSTYASTAGLVLMSDWDAKNRHRFCHCCIRNKRCRLWKFCCHCAYTKQNEIVTRYLPAFPKGNFWFVTLSFKGGLRFEVPHDEHPLPYWDAARMALREMLADYSIDGALWVEELYIRSYLPLEVLPHCHAIIDATEFADDAKEKLTGSIIQFSSEQVDGDGVELPFDLDVKPILDQQHFINCLRYLIKPIDLVTAYSQAITTADRVELNQAVDSLLNGHLLHCFQRPQLMFIGSLDPKRKRHFLGNPA